MMDIRRNKIKPVVPPKPAISPEIVKILINSDRHMSSSSRPGSRSNSLPQTASDHNNNVDCRKPNLLSDSNQDLFFKPSVGLQKREESAEDVFSNNNTNDDDPNNNRLSAKVPPPLPFSRVAGRLQNLRSKFMIPVLEAEPKARQPKTTNLQFRSRKDSKNGSVSGLDSRVSAEEVPGPRSAILDVHCLDRLIPVEFNSCGSLSSSSIDISSPHTASSDAGFREKKMFFENLKMLNSRPPNGRLMGDKTASLSRIKDDDGYLAPITMMKNKKDISNCYDITNTNMGICIGDEISSDSIDKQQISGTTGIDEKPKTFQRLIFADVAPNSEALTDSIKEIRHSEEQAEFSGSCKVIDVPSKSKTLGNSDAEKVLSSGVPNSVLLENKVESCAGSNKENDTVTLASMISAVSAASSPKRNLISHQSRTKTLDHFTSKLDRPQNRLDRGLSEGVNSLDVLVPIIGTEDRSKSRLKPSRENKSKQRFASEFIGHASSELQTRAMSVNILAPENSIGESLEEDSSGINLTTSGKWKQKSAINLSGSNKLPGINSASDLAPRETGSPSSTPSPKLLHRTTSGLKRQDQIGRCPTSKFYTKSDDGAGSSDDNLLMKENRPNVQTLPCLKSKTTDVFLFSKMMKKKDLPVSSSIFYLPMDRLNPPPVTADYKNPSSIGLMATSCCDLSKRTCQMEKGQPGSMVALNDAKHFQLDNQKQHCSLADNNTFLSPCSTVSSLSNLDVFSPTSKAAGFHSGIGDAVRSETRVIEQRASDVTDSPDSNNNDDEEAHSDDNYGTIDEDYYIVRDDLDLPGKTPTVQSSFDATERLDSIPDVLEFAAAAAPDDRPRDFDFSNSDVDGSVRDSRIRSSSDNESQTSSNESEMKADPTRKKLAGSADNSCEGFDSPSFLRHFQSSFSSSSGSSSTLSLNTGSSFNSSCRSLLGYGPDRLDGSSECSADSNNLTPTTTKPNELVKKKSKDPYLVAKEIVTSEEIFISVLKLLNEDFPGFIKSERAQGRVNDGPADVKQLFYGLPNLQEVNKELYKQLKQRLENWETNPRMADIFVKTGHFLKLYTNYIKNFSRMVQELDVVRRKNPEFDRALAEFESSSQCKRLALKHYMLKPIQRIPQYKLLLQEYLKCLSPDSPDYQSTKDAIPVVAGVSEHANESVKNWENQCKMIQIQSLLGGYKVVTPVRKFLKEGRLMKLSRKEMQTRMFFLFNDTLLYTTPTGANSYKVNQAISLDGLTVVCPKMEDFENEFSIISVERSFTVAASSAVERQQWVSALEAAVRERADVKYSRKKALRQQRWKSRTLRNKLAAEGGAIVISDTCGRFRELENKKDQSLSSDGSFKVGDRAPVWIQDERASMCAVCTREFSMTFRRHHCRGCGKIVCSDCSQCRAPLKYNGFKPARVCEDCYEYLKTELLADESGGDNDAKLTKDSEDELESSADQSIVDLSAEKKLSSLSAPTGGNAVSPFDKKRLSLLFKKKSNGNRSSIKPMVLIEVPANDGDSEMSGYLVQLEKKSWKKYWFVLKNKVLYTFKAMQDKAALKSMPVLGFQIMNDDNDDRMFKLEHGGLPAIVMRAETFAIKEKWIEALLEAAVV